MDAKQITDLLSKVDIFKGLPPLLVPTIADQFKVVNFKAQEILIKQNQKAQNFYIISQGRLDVYVKDQKSGQNHISYLLPRDYFGDIYLLYDQPSATEIKAVEDRLLPGLSGHIVHKEAATPLTYERFVAKQGGAVLGLALNIGQEPITSAVLPIEGLYCVGDTLTGALGVPGSVMSGVGCAKGIIDSASAK